MAVTQYIGARYVPIFADPVEWSGTKSYEPLTIVTHEGNSYTSRSYVPVGVEIDDERYWAKTGNYNAQIEQYRRDVELYREDVADVSGKLEQKMFKFATVSEMCVYEGLESDALCETAGFYSESDGGGATYIITSGDTANGYDILACQDGLTAKLIVDDTVSALCLGAKNTNESPTQTRAALQYALDNYNAVMLPDGVYTIDGPLTVHARTTLYGEHDLQSWTRNSLPPSIDAIPKSGAIIALIGSSNSNAIEIDISALENGYVPNVKIRNLLVFGVGSCNIGVYARRLVHSTLENVFIQNFNIGLKVASNMLCEYKKILIQHCESSCLEFEGITTTTSFYNLYVGQCNDYQNCIGIKIPNNTCLGVSFYSPTLESIYTGMEITEQANVDVYDVYTENIPPSNSVDEYGCFAKIVGPSSSAPQKNTSVRIYGGLLQGNNYNHRDDAYCFDVSGVCDVVVSGCKITRWKQALNLVSGYYQNINFICCYEITVTNNLYDSYASYPNSIELINCFNLFVPNTFKDTLVKRNYISSVQTVETNAYGTAQITLPNQAVLRNLYENSHDYLCILYSRNQTDKARIKVLNQNTLTPIASSSVTVTVNYQ